MTSDHIRHCVEILARTPMDGISLEEWGIISNTFLQAADRLEALEAALRERAMLMVRALPELRGGGAETLADEIAHAIWHGPDLSEAK